MVYQKWKINHESFNGYVFGSDDNLYKLPYENKQGHYRALRKIKVITKGSKTQEGLKTIGYLGYWINSIWWSLAKIRPFLVEITDGELIENKTNHPF